MSDLQLKFGVSGGGSLSGDSGHEILTDLQNICSNISRSKILKVSVHLDNKTKFGGLLDELQSITANTQKIKLRFGVDTKYLDEEMKHYFSSYKAPSAAVRNPNQLYGSAKKELNTLLKLETDLNTKRLNPAVEKAKRAELKVHEDAYDAILMQIDGLDDEIQKQTVLNKLLQEEASLRSKYATVGVSNEQKSNSSLVNNLIKEQKAISDIEKATANRTYSSEEQASFDARKAAHIEAREALYAQINAITDVTEKERLLAEVAEKRKKIEDSTTDAIAREKAEIASLYKEASKYLSDHGDAIKVRAPQEYKELVDLTNKLASGKIDISTDEARAQLDRLKGKLKESGKDVDTLGQKFKKAFGDKLFYGITAALALLVRKYLKQMIEEVKAIDAAMTELKKVTDLTDASYERFLTKACARAKQLGATVSDTVNATADFARLGYGVEEASKLADAAIVYKNVGDGIESITQASESIISTMKAFNIEAQDAMLIVDKFNEVGNNFAISSTGIGEALLNSAAALAAGGNTLDDSIALITAANEVIQNPAKVGTALKTVSMYLRASKEEAEAAGIATDGMAKSTSELRKKILSLTDNRVDIMIDDSTFKDTTEVFRELSKIWDDLSGVDRATIEQLIGGGVRNGNIINAILTNFDTVEKVIATSAGSAGSALAENEDVLDSINGKLNVLKATFQELSSEVFESDDVKRFISVLTTLVEWLQLIEDKFGVIKATAAALGIKTYISGINEALKDTEGAALKAGAALKKGFSNLSLGGKIGVIISLISLLDGIVKIANGKGIFDMLEDWNNLPSLWDELDKTNEELDEIYETIKSINKERESYVKDYDDVVPRFLELYEKSGALGSQGLLDDSEYSEFLSLQGQIADLFPEIDLGIDSNGKRMLALAGTIDVVSDSLEHLKQIALGEMNDKTLDAYDEAVNKYIEYRDKQQDAVDFSAGVNEEALWYVWSILTSGKSALHGDSIVENYVARTKSNGNQVFYAPNVPGGGSAQEMIDLFQLLLGEYFVGWSFNPLKMAREIEIKPGWEKTAQKNLEFLLDTDYFLQMFQDEMDAAAQEFITMLPMLLSSYEGMGLIDSTSQSIISGMISSIDPQIIFDAVGEDATGEEVQKWLYDTYAAPFIGFDLDSLIDKYSNGEISLEQFGDAILEHLQDLPPDVQKAFIDFVNNAFNPGHAVHGIIDAAGILVGEFARNVENRLNQTDFTSFMGDPEAFIEGLEGVEEAADIYARAVQTIADASYGVAVALANTQTEADALDDIMSRASSFDLSLLSNPENVQYLLSIMPHLRVYFDDFFDVIEHGTDEDKVSAAKKLFDAIADGANDVKRFKADEAIRDVIKAVDDYGSDSIQVQTAMSNLAEYCPSLVDALWDEEQGLYALGNSADSARAALLALNSVDLFSTLVASSQRVRTIQNQIDAWNPGMQSAGVLNSLSAERDKVEKEIANEVEFIQSLFEQSDKWSSVGGGGGSSKTPADNIKEAFDALSSSIETSIQQEEEFFEQGKKNLNADIMHNALMKQIAYYQQIQREASTALDAVKEYYRGQGMSEGAIDQQSQVVDLTNSYLDATKNVRDAVDRMTSAIVDAFGEAIDSMQSVYDSLHKAADEYAESGYITVDTLQEVISHGVEYLSILQDENGQLVINEDNINKVISARTEQLAVETALAYIEALHAARVEDNITELNRLLYATNEATEAQWGLVYAALALENLDEEQNSAALHVIDSLRAMTESAQRSIGQTADSATDALKKTKEELEEMKSGVDDILEYTMEMIEHNIEQQIEAIEEQKEAFAEYIEMQKEALDNAEEEADYEEKKAEILKKLVSLQSDIDSLNLVGTREAESERAKLLEEQAELQKELADLQGDYAVEAQKEALDKMQEAYEEEKDNEIKDLETSISSQQKLYDEAINYIENNWENLYQHLTNWNYEYGSVLKDEIKSAWDSAYEAADRYGSYLEALKDLENDIGDIDEKINHTSDNKNKNYHTGDTPNYDHVSSDEDQIRIIVTNMKRNSETWKTASAARKDDLAAENAKYGLMLNELGVPAVRGDDGVWYVGGEQLYKKYAIYHTGGIVGGGDIKSNEQFALLEKREWVLSENMVDNLTRHLSLMSKLGDFASRFFNSQNYSLTSKISDLFTGNTQRLLAATNARPIQISIGDTYISGMPDDTVKQHQSINKKFMDDLARQLGARW